MPQPDLVSSFWPADDQHHPETEPLPEANRSGLPILPQDHQELLDRLTQANSLDEERLARIYQLEQALDQALTYLKELKAKLQNQELLEAQLATTEEFTHVQQQAIARLKLQLDQQRQALEAHVQGVEGHEKAVHSFLTMTESMAQAQYAELERLRSRIAQDWAQAQRYRMHLEQQLKEVYTTLEDQQQKILELESQLLTTRTQSANLDVQFQTTQQHIQDLSVDSSHPSIPYLKEPFLKESLEQSEEQSDTTSWEQTIVVKMLRRARSLTAERDTVIHALRQDLALAQIKVEELETQLAKQLKVQARVQQSHQELEESYSYYQTRSSELEQQTTEMQEQIFKQAKQAGEYEAAVQHWKDRYYDSQRQMAQLQDILKRSLAHLDADPDGSALSATTVRRLLALLQTKTSSESGESERFTAFPASRFNTLDVPDFLIKRRNYRHR